MLKTNYNQDSNENDRLRIIIAASEAVPWSKTGGLGDVSTALAKSLDALGHSVSLIVPFHRQTKFALENANQIFDSGSELKIQVGKETVKGNVHWTKLPNSGVQVLLIDQPDYFDRPGLYQNAGEDFSDNCSRFVFFCRAVLETAKQLVLRPDVIHCNDWQTGLIPAMLEIEKRTEPEFKNCGSVFTIHNLAFQGSFWHHDMELTGLDWKHFNWKQMECHQRLNFLKTGLSFADQITTVSPTYAKEIQTEEYGCGLEGLLGSRAGDLTGILNGIDENEWNPEIDPLICTNYSTQSVFSEKQKCKAYLQQRMGLPQRSDVPVFGMVSRMTDQKGCDLILDVAHSVLEQHDIQFAILGSGDARYEQMFSELSRKFPDKIAATIGFNEQLAHEIEAGSEFYLMPSRFEPCGLNQMYSLAYGTVPLVRATGGLADSVVDTTDETLKNETASGIVFRDYSSDAFGKAVNRCIQLYANKDSYQRVVKTGMNRDSSWLRSANEYLSVFEKAIAKRTQRVRA